jgi:hypothetical protein
MSSPNQRRWPLVVILQLVAIALLANAAPKKPNFLVILTDDQGKCKGVLKQLRGSMRHSPPMFIRHSQPTASQLNVAAWSTCDLSQCSCKCLHASYSN